MKRYLFIINLFLATIAIVLSLRLYEGLSSPSKEVRPLQKKASSENKKVETIEVNKDLKAYDDIVQKDLFRPTRTELRPEDTGKPALPPTPPPKLFGVMILDGDKIALLEDPVSMRRKKYRIKDSIGDFVLTEIEGNKIILMRGEEKVEVNLREVKTITPPSRPSHPKLGVPPRPVRPSPPPPRPVRPSPPPHPMPPMPEEIEGLPGGMEEFPEGYIEPLPSEFGQ